VLKGIDNRLNAEVLACLRAMGHGDVLIVADTNFPSDQVARATVTGKLLRMENLTAPRRCSAILSVLPLDTFVDDFAGRMEVVGKPDRSPRCRPRCRPRSTGPRGGRARWSGIERFAFYDMARNPMP
jgi:L-fucose mutarotase